MRYELASWAAASGWTFCEGAPSVGTPQLVLYFGAPGCLVTAYEGLRGHFPSARLMGCSTGGEILGTEVLDDHAVAVAVQFDRTGLRSAVVDNIDSSRQSFDAGLQLGQALSAPDLKGVLVLSDGTRVNGSDLVRGLAQAVGRTVPITGGLAGDGDAFRSTLVGCGGPPQAGTIAALGFYGDAIQFRHGCRGGWDPFGPERLVTRASGNILYELDGQPALALYRKYLGEEAKDLPGSALLYPLAVRGAGDRGEVVRTIVGIDDENEGMIFAGEVREGQVARLMKGNFDRLVEGAEQAARLAVGDAPREGGLAILISCIGRKMLLGQRIVDEVEATQDFLGGEVGQIGFYSYGEISPLTETSPCDVHNQTMTITLLREG